MRPIVVFTLIVLCVLGCQQSNKPAPPPKGKQAKSAADWASHGVDLRNADKKEEAVKAYDEAIKLDPNLDAAIYNRALIYAELGRNEEAVAARDDLVKRNSTHAKQLRGFLALNSDAHVSMGNKHLAINEWDLALEKYKIALIYDSQSAHAFVGLGLARVGQKKYREAVTEFDRAIQINPKLAIAHHNRGIANRERKDFEKAVADLTTAIEIDLANPQAYAERAIAYDGLGDKAKADADRKKAAELGKVEPKKK